MTALALAALLALPVAADSRERRSTAAVPLPKPRPEAAPQRPATQTTEPAQPSQPPAPPPPSACRLALTEQIAVAPSVPDENGANGCGGEDLVRLEAVLLPDASRLQLKPAATMRCEVAATLAAWVREDLVAALEPRGEAVTLHNLASYECRGRNRVAGAKLSEHGCANAIDLRGVSIGARSLDFTDRNVPRETRERLLQSMCSRFTTVLGPGSDGYHEDHIHLDLVARRSGYRICQWVIDDPMPWTAPLLPAPRPADAPSAEKADDRGQSDRRK